MGTAASAAAALNPDVALLTKIGSALVHAQELLEPGGHEFDLAAFTALMDDPDVRQWLTMMDGLALLSQKRSA